LSAFYNISVWHCFSTRISEMEPPEAQSWRFQDHVSSIVFGLTVESSWKRSEMSVFDCVYEYIRSKRGRDCSRLDAHDDALAWRRLQLPHSFSQRVSHAVLPPGLPWTFPVNTASTSSSLQHLQTLANIGSSVLSILTLPTNVIQTYI